MSYLIRVTILYNDNVSVFDYSMSGLQTSVCNFFLRDLQYFKHIAVNQGYVNK